MLPSPLDLNNFYLFAKVVEHQGFSAAGNALGIPKSRISRCIAALEEQLSIRLLYRTSRRLALTDAGQALYEHCQAMIAEAEAGVAAVSSRTLEPSGLVRVSIPVLISEIDSMLQTDLLPRFMALHPKIRLALRVSRHNVDLTEKNFDIAVKEVDNVQSPSSIVQVPLGTLRWDFVATPGYMKDAGPVNSPEALSGLRLLLHDAAHDSLTKLHLAGPGGKEAIIAVKPFLQSNSILFLKKAVMSGSGVACLPLQACFDELQGGTLRAVLPDWSPQNGRIALCFPTRSGMMPAIRAAIDFMKTEIPGVLFKSGYAFDGKNRSTT